MTLIPMRGMDSQPISPDNFAFVCELVQREAAIVIGSGKEYLVESRLSDVAARNQYPSVNALVDHMRHSGGGFLPLHREAIDALTTNETLFFRDFHPFEALKTGVFPALFNQRPDGKFHVWSAACSSGQEPYSLAMLLAENFPVQAGRVSIFATDLCGAVLRRARSGLYQQLEVNRGLPANMLVKYFRQQPEGWQIDENIRKRVEFRELNLVKPWPVMPRFDLVMIRNVMIYFDLPTRKKILDQVQTLLSPGGFLLLGGAETTLMVTEGFVPVSFGRTTFYKRIADV